MRKFSSRQRRSREGHLAIRKGHESWRVAMEYPRFPVNHDHPFRALGGLVNDTFGQIWSKFVDDITATGRDEHSIRCHGRLVRVGSNLRACQYTVDVNQ